MTPFENWKKKFDRYRWAKMVIEKAVKNEVKTIISADTDDNSNHYNFALDDNDDEFAAALQNELQRAIDAETLLSVEELQQAQAYKLAPDDLS